jgi:hypothetical protein
MPIYNTLTWEIINPKKYRRLKKLKGVIKGGKDYEKSCLERIADLRDIELIASNLESFQKECKEKGIGHVEEFITEILAGLAKKQREIFKAIII